MIDEFKDFFGNYGNNVLTMRINDFVLWNEKEYSNHPFGLLPHLSSGILEDGSLYCFVRNIHKSNNY